MTIKLPAALLVASLACAGGAIGAFCAGGVLLIVVGVVAAALAVLLALAGVGLATDPSARHAVQQRLAQARGEELPAPTADSDAADQGEPVAAAEPVSGELEQGFTVPANRAERRAQAKAQSRAGRDPRR